VRTIGGTSKNRIRLGPCARPGDIFLRRIVFNCRGYLNQYPEYQAFRALDLANRLEYGLDEEVRQFVGECLRVAGEERFVAAVRDHRPDLTEAALRQLFEQNTHV
jgi:hypothetical protein